MDQLIRGQQMLDMVPELSMLTRHVKKSLSHAETFAQIMKQKLLPLRQPYNKLRKHFQETQIK